MTKTNTAAAEIPEKVIGTARRAAVRQGRPMFIQATCGGWRVFASHAIPWQSAVRINCDGAIEHVARGVLSSF